MTTATLIFAAILAAIVCVVALWSHFSDAKDPLDKWAESVGLSSGSDDPHP